VAGLLSWLLIASELILIAAELNAAIPSASRARACGECSAIPSRKIVAASISSGPPPERNSDAATSTTPSPQQSPTYAVVRRLWRQTIASLPGRRRPVIPIG
jgi:hypothetical protein